MNKKYTIGDASFDNNQLNNVDGIQYEYDGVLIANDLLNQVGNKVKESAVKFGKDLIKEVLIGK